MVSVANLNPLRLFDRVRDGIGLTAEEQLIVATVREVALEQIAPRAAEYDRAGSFPRDSVRALNELGLNGVFVPEAYGGSPLSYTCYLLLVEEVASACASTAVTWATAFHAARPIIVHGTEEQRQRFLPSIAAGGLASLDITEATGGSDVSTMRTTFAEEGDSIVVQGEKVFITNGDVAKFHLVFGKWAELGDSRDAISVVIVEGDAPGLKIGRREDKLGHRASSTVEVVFDDCRVPRSNLLGEPGRGMSILFGALNESRPSVAAQALGIARAAFHDAVIYTNERRQFGRRIAEFQGVQFALADLAARLAQAEAWMLHVGRLVDAGHSDIAAEASILKLAATDLAMDVAVQAVQLHGGAGYTREHRVERLFRDAKLTQIWEGANEMHRQLIGRSFVGKWPADR
jgi:alkylation response protein AidB-like acyl-CoA dehydrogenase